MVPWPSIAALLQDRARRDPHRELFRFEGTSWTVGQIDEDSSRLARVLVRWGIRKGDRVALMIPNGIEFPTCWMALAKVGAVMVPLNTQYQEADLGHVLADSGARLALAGAREAGRLTAVRDRVTTLETIAVLGQEVGPGIVSLAAELSAPPSRLEGDAVGADDLMSIQYTSGTTGFPKGCMLSHAYMLRMGTVPAEAYGVTERDVMLTAQPYSYLDPQWATALCLVAGCPLVILPRFSASTFWQSVKDHGVTFFYVLGTMPVFLYKQPENPAVERSHRVRVAVCSGIPRELHAAMEARWGCPWREGYGSTESGVDLVVLPEETDSVGSGRMGRPVRGREATVVDAQGRELPDGEVGELLLRGEGMMRGYWNNAAATAEKFAGGWLHTGDLVVRDEAGHFRLVGRTKDMIRRTGENIAAAEVEAVLCEHPAVRAAAVVPVPDELRGEEVKAFVQLQPGQTPATAPPDALLEFVRARLAPFKVPRFLEYVDRFPLTPSERVAKPELLRATGDPRARAYDALSHRWGFE
jgi:acyl-CoA synthetase (AMP-forming)/AMP-acid ligase II